MKHFLQNLKYDLPAGLVVFFVALPLCLGIALASGAPLFSGIISGIVGGVFVGAISGSKVGVSGPAAGLATIVFAYIASLGGSFSAFLTAVVLMGVIQLALGIMRLGSIAYYFPSSVIKGMLCGIGILIIIKQLPHAFGFYGDFPRDFAIEAIQVSPGILHFLNEKLDIHAILISAFSLALMIIFETSFIKKFSFTKVIQAPLLVVAVGILLNQFLPLEEHQIVAIPVAANAAEFFSQFARPDFSQLNNPNIYVMALVMALVASIETLLCVEACDKIDPEKNITPTNRELKAQGLGNILSGLIGGLPITQVIVRTSANISFGAKSKAATIFHGILLLVCAITIPGLLNQIPLASLACILLVVGYKLAKPQIFIKIYKLKSEQFTPFILTILGMIFFDLLKGVGIGLAAACAFVLYNNFRNSFSKFQDKEIGENIHKIELCEEASFLNKGAILQLLKDIPPHSKVFIDASRSKSIHYDIIEMIHDFKIHARANNIKVQTKGLTLKKI
jgi:MFS superfamily sulfate permease-like transporter